MKHDELNTKPTTKQGIRALLNFFRTKPRTPVISAPRMEIPVRNRNEETPEERHQRIRDEVRENLFMRGLWV